MMTTAILLSCIFLILGAIHVNWVLGGTFGFAQSLPTDEAGVRVLNPRKIDSAIVAVGLTACGIYYFLISGVITVALPDWVTMIAGWGIPSIFALRAIGEFKYVGFFKKVRNTPFGKLDTTFFSPLCLGIAILGFIQQTLT